jgi:hypothetical protein
VISNQKKFTDLNVICKISDDKKVQFVYSQPDAKVIAESNKFIGNHLLCHSDCPTDLAAYEAIFGVNVKATAIAGNDISKKSGTVNVTCENGNNVTGSGNRYRTEFPYVLVDCSKEQYASFTYRVSSVEWTGGMNGIEYLHCTDDCPADMAGYEALFENVNVTPIAGISISKEGGKVSVTCGDGSKVVATGNSYQNEFSNVQVKCRYGEEGDYASYEYTVSNDQSTGESKDIVEKQIVSLRCTTDKNAQPSSKPGTEPAVPASNSRTGKIIWIGVFVICAALAGLGGVRYYKYVKNKGASPDGNDLKNNDASQDGIELKNMGTSPDGNAVKNNGASQDGIGANT